MVEYFSVGRACRSWIGRFVLVLVTAISMLIAVAGGASAIESLRQYAGIVVDAKSGAVLYEHEADAKRYPASLTKVMTLYILFQELDAGTVRIEDRMKVSTYAAAAEPTKLGLKPGWTITVSDAMKSLVTLSANDMARVIAEHISGSEAQFARRMTATARALGMSRTTYRNASGLPDAAQVTTARDQTTLGIAIRQHFPQYYDLFQTGSFTYRDRTYRNHNRLLGADGVDGIKTGYTSASGFNLLTAAEKGHRHIVVAAIGFSSSAARDARVRELVREHFKSGRKGSTLQAALIPLPGRKGAVRVAAVEGVTPRPYPDFRKAAMSNKIAVATAVAAVDAANMLGKDTARTGTDAAGQPSEAVGAWVGETYSLSATEAAPTKAVPSTHGQAWIVQIGAAPSRPRADVLLENAVEQVPQLQDLQPYVERFERGEQTIYRARFAGFDAREDATDLCKQLLETKVSCLALQSQVRATVQSEPHSSRNARAAWSRNGLTR